MLRKRISNFVDFMRTFSLGDLFPYLARRIFGQNIVLHPISIFPYPIICRARTTDYETAWNVFVNKMPDIEFFNLKNARYILDLGANIGCVASVLANNFPKSLVVAVEMDEQNYKIASSNCAHFKNIRLVNAAFWYFDGTVAYSPDCEADAFRISTEENSKLAKRSEAIACDSLMKQFGVPYWDFVKIDIEGAESEVVLKNNKWLNAVSNLTLEVHNSTKMINYQMALERLGFWVELDKRHWSSLNAQRSPQNDLNINSIKPSPSE
jgi:FkbM family methyltransferase